jgi:hypothetical protein
MDFLRLAGPESFFQLCKELHFALTSFILFRKIETRYPNAMMRSRSARRKQRAFGWWKKAQKADFLALEQAE